ncbi:MAG: carbohydrate ABC transporter permease [Bacillati bacterium ANGP1]|uniref:Carbohydrate ABC transporter permease n=1 Tax=Candidatus Segetimicrobium genomatis TaxID=2569760 RepID=A0A537LQ15_9BACT|nr:MAG: carbohydrate ABC transporter permease [Terrabacteria group bacterium ANGP1]
MLGTCVWALLVGALAFVWVFPLLWAFTTSLRPPGQLGSQIASLWVHHPSFANFTEAWSDAPFLRLYYNTAVVVFGILAVQLVTITLAAYAFARLEFWGRDLLFRVFLLQLMVAPSALIFPNFQTIKSLGLLNTRLGIMIPYFASAFGTFLLRQTFRTVPRDLEDAAAIDGCGSLQTIWNVFLPLAKPTLVAFSIVSVVYHYNEFLWPLIITDTERARTVTVGLASFTQSAESGAQWNLIAAGTVIVILPLLVVFILFQRRFVESFMYSGIKG